MRVLLVGTGVHPIPPVGYGGVERSLAELARALRAEGAEVVVLQRVRKGRSTDEYRFAYELPRLLRAERFDALHASTPVVANRLALARIPYVYTTHSRHWFLRSGFRERWGFFLERRAVVHARAMVALTEPVRSRVRSELGGRAPARMPVIPIGVDVDRYGPEWGRRTGRRAVGVGIVRRFKRWEIAARALRGLGVDLELFGPTPDAAYAQELRAIGEHVHLRGEVEDRVLVEELAGADLLLHPSAVELLAGVVLQGLASGLPILGAEPVAGLVEEGRTGFTTPPGATDGQIATAMRGWVIDLTSDSARRRAMGEAARESARRRFAWPVVARAHLALYGETGAA